MSLVLNEEQVFLKDSAKKFASEKTPTTHFREVRDSEIDNCYDDKIWQEMVSLGWTGILVPEEFGGSNFGVATPKFEPPNSSGTKIPVQPSETISCQILSS